MSLEDELRQHFASISTALEKYGDMPRAKEALRYLEAARVSVVRVDTREAYLKEVLTPEPGTICIFLGGNRHQPVRKKVLHVTSNAVVTEWHEQKRLQRRFDHQGVQVDPLRDHQKESDVLDHMELKALLATTRRVRA